MSYYDPVVLAFRGPHQGRERWTAWIDRIHEQERNIRDARTAAPTDNHDPGDEDRC